MSNKKTDVGATSFSEMDNPDELVSVFDGIGDLFANITTQPKEAEPKKEGKKAEIKKTEPKMNDTYNKEETHSVPKVKESKKKAKKPVGRPKLNRETTERRTFTILPSLYNKAMDKAREEGKTLSEVVSALLSEYVKDSDCEDNI